MISSFSEQWVKTFEWLNWFIVNLEMVACIYYCDFGIMNKNARLNITIWVKLNTYVCIRYQHASSYYSDTQPVAIFALIKTSQ